jgi:hypothetical protein
MINIIFGTNFILGLIILFLIPIVYGIQKAVKPIKITNLLDLFYFATSFLYLIIIIIHGWRLDPILLFSQYVLLFFSIGLVREVLSLRGLLDYRERQLIRKNHLLVTLEDTIEICKNNDIQNVKTDDLANILFLDDNSKYNTKNLN